MFDGNIIFFSSLSDLTISFFVFEEFTVFEPFFVNSSLEIFSESSGLSESFTTPKAENVSRKILRTVFFRLKKNHL